MPSQRQPQQVNIFLLLIIFILIALLFVFFMTPSGGTGGVAAATSRGGRMLVLRLPPADNQRQQQIVVFTNEPLPKPRLVVLQPVPFQPGDLHVEKQISLEQWKVIDNLRQKWCSNPPNFSIEQTKIFYDVGIRCEVGGFRSAERVVIPIEELPLVLEELINTFGDS
jgi:hypothetical protein